MNGTLEQRGKNSWRITVFIGRDPLTGEKRFRREPFKGTRIEAESYRHKLCSDILDEKPDTTDSFGSILDKWYALKVRGFSPSTARETKRLIEKRIKPALGPTPLKKMRAVELDAFYGALLAAGLSPGYVKRIHGVIHAALEQAVKWSLLERNPAAATTPPTVDPSNIKPPSPARVREIMAELEENDPKLIMLIRLASTTGTRRGQLCALKWTDVDWDDEVLSISNAIVLGPDGPVEKLKGKTNASTRVVSLGKATISELRGLYVQAKANALACGVRLKEDSYIFSDDVYGKVAWRPDAVTHSFQRATQPTKQPCGDVVRTGAPCRNWAMKGTDRCVRHGGRLLEPAEAKKKPKNRLHDLKHFAATQMLAAGEPITVVAERLGTDAQTILRVYAKFIPGSDRRAADAMDKVLEG